MRGARTSVAWPVGAALAVAALSLALPWALAFDPWGWTVWGREVTRGALDTSGGPAWKPLPVVFTSAFAVTGQAAPALWLVVARAGALLALAGAHRLAARLGGPVAAWTAVAAIALSDWWLFNAALGNAEGLMAAAVLWAAVAHLTGRRRAALVLGAVAALVRPEAWPFLAAYVFWLRRDGERLPVLAAALVPVAVLWLGPDVLGAGGAVGAAGAGRFAGPESALRADVPGLEVLLDFSRLLTLPVLVAAVAGAAFGGRPARGLAAGALAWVALVAVMSQAGYAGNPRYNVAPAALCCVLAGVGIAAAGRRLARRRAGGRPAASAVAGGRSAASGVVAGGRSAGSAVAGGRSAASGVVAGALLVAAVLAVNAGTLADQVAELGERARRGNDLARLVERAGGAAAVKRCGAVRTAQPVRSIVAWHLDVSMAGLGGPRRGPVVVLRAAAGDDGGAPVPVAPAGVRPLLAEGGWTLLAACRLRPAAAGGTGS